MKKVLYTLTFSTLLLASATPARAQVSFGIHIGQPPVERAYRVPPQPGPDYDWIEGYWYPQGRQYRWHDGYWTRPPYQGAYWVAPYYNQGQYYQGEWRGDDRANVAHDHRWDRSHQRDEGRYDGRDDRNSKNGHGNNHDRDDNNGHGDDHDRDDNHGNDRRQ